VTDRIGVTVKWPLLIVSAALLVAAGAGGSYLVFRERASATPATPPGRSEPHAPAVATPPDALVSNTGPWPDVSMTLTRDALQRADLEIVTVTPGGGAGTPGHLAVTGIVQPNGYRTIKVTPVAPGRITRVLVELGQQVKPGQTLAEIYSPELTEAQTRYLSARAALDAHDRMLQRTEKLVEIGSASRQELEQVHAEHTAATTAVESARSRLLLLGMSDDEIAKLSASTPPTATARIVAPIDGALTERFANVGLNVDAATPLFTIVDLSSVWVVGNVYESDFARVSVGTAVTVALRAYPGVALHGRISYVDPQVNPETRTAQVRVELPNPRGQLKLNMYADLTVDTKESGTTLTVPRTAVQMAGDRAVVYLAGTEEGHFVEREVRLGASAGDRVEVTSGVQPGDRVVAKGSFVLRAERERLGLRPPARDR
jgi:cobalt-zinc-cadmium efflux system membrane fusion protein